MDHKVAKRYSNHFFKLISYENLTADHIYNADETLLYWNYFPRKTLATSGEMASIGIKDAKDMLTQLNAANAAIMYKCKLLVIHKSQAPRALKGGKNISCLLLCK